MTKHLQSLIAALRDELQQYGEMLALLDQQQELIMARAAEELYHTVTRIEQQADVLREARAQREQARRTLATALLRSPETTFMQLLGELPPDYRPLVQALVEENNQLLGRVQQRVRQNHLLLSRSVDMMQRLINTLFPSRDPLVYNGSGRRSPPPAQPRPIYEAVG